MSDPDAPKASENAADSQAQSLVNEPIDLPANGAAATEGNGTPVEAADAAGLHEAHEDEEIPKLPVEGPGAGYQYLRRYTGKDFTTGQYAGYHNEHDDEDEEDVPEDEEAQTGTANGDGTLKTTATAGTTAGISTTKRRKKKPIDWKKTMMLAYACFGAVFGDIGTSPIYVFTATYSQLGGRDPTENEILGLMSLIFWSFTLIVIVEYCLIVLFADNHGEGGTIALYSLLCRYGEEWFNTGLSDQEMDFTVSSKDELDKRNKEQKWSKRYSKWFQNFTMGCVIGGVALLLGDGVLTPAISVLSAVEGIAVAAPATQPAIVPVTIIILLLLFLVQFLGTNKVGAIFSPIVILWLLLLAGMGIFNMVKFGPGVLKALNPQYMFMYFIDLGQLSWRMMGGVMLSITGTEALFADLGHFSRLSIQLATICVVYPCLILQYLGQSAALLSNPSQWNTSFWSSVPGPLYWLIVVLSVLATVIASQALISASFSVVSQAMRLNLFPPVKIVHTSAHHATQIYSPDVNYTLMVVTIIIVAAFQSSEALAGAYGIAVCMDMLLTTCLIATVMRLVWKWNIIIPIIFLLVYGVIVGAYLSSNLLKVPKGGWLPLAMAAVLATIMGIWRWGKGLTMQQKWRFRKPYNKMFSLLTSDTAISASGAAKKAGAFAVADLETVPAVAVEGAPDDDSDYDSSDDDSSFNAMGVPLSAVSSRDGGAPSSVMRRRISVFDVGYPALMPPQSTVSASAADRGRRMSEGSAISGRSRSISVGPTVPAVVPPIIPNSILVTSAAPAPTNEAKVGFGDEGPPATTASAPAPAVKFGGPSQVTVSAPELPGASSSFNSMASMEGGAAAAVQMRGILATSSGSGFPRTITGESRSIRIVTGSTKSQSISDGVVGDLSVNVTSAGLLDADIPIPRFPGLGIFYTEITSGIPGVFAHVVNNLGTIPQIVVFATIRYSNYPHIEEQDRLFVTKGLLNGFWKAVITLGYMDEIIDSDWITDEIIAAISRVETRFQSAMRQPTSGSTTSSSAPPTFMLGKALAQEVTVDSTVVGDSAVANDGTAETRTSEEMMRAKGRGPVILPRDPSRGVSIMEAESEGVVYFLGKRRYVSKEDSNVFHRFFVGFYKTLVLFSRAGGTQLNVPDDQTIEVGLRVRL